MQAAGGGRILRTLKLLWQLTIPSLVRPAAAPGRSRDPAPSVWAYRYQRLMLTPFYRRLFRIGGPVALVLLVLGGEPTWGDVDPFLGLVLHQVEHGSATQLIGLGYSLGLGGG